MVVTSLTRQEAKVIFEEIGEVQETDFYWYVESMAEIFERHGWVKHKPTECPGKPCGGCASEGTC